MKTIIINFGILLLAIFIINCENSTDERIKGEVSSCQGFGYLAKGAITKPPLNIDSASYCTAERLVWEYDTMSSTLRLLHTRQLRNCASKLSVEAIVNDNNITVVESDHGDPNIVARCECPFDTYIEVPEIKSESITVAYSKKSLLLQLKEVKGTIVLDSSDIGICR